jgi:hypothetical protein
MIVEFVRGGEDTQKDHKSYTLLHKREGEKKNFLGLSLSLS